MNPLLVIAAKKLSAIETESFFAERRARANDQEFLRILHRKGGDPPRPEDTLE